MLIFYCVRFTVMQQQRTKNKSKHDRSEEFEFGRLLKLITCVSETIN